nr:hypothetical protein StreXyl84_76470 [Streptomyces sp. Xyl84]
MRALSHLEVPAGSRHLCRPALRSARLRVCGRREGATVGGREGGRGAVGLDGLVRSLPARRRTGLRRGPGARRPAADFAGLVVVTAAAGVLLPALRASRTSPTWEAAFSPVKSPSAATVAGAGQQGGRRATGAAGAHEGRRGLARREESSRRPAPVIGGRLQDDLRGVARRVCGLRRPLEDGPAMPALAFSSGAIP